MRFVLSLPRPPARSVLLDGLFVLALHIFLELLDVRHVRVVQIRRV